MTHFSQDYSDDNGSAMSKYMDDDSRDAANDGFDDGSIDAPAVPVTKKTPVLAGLFGKKTDNAFLDDNEEEGVNDDDDNDDDDDEDYASKDAAAESHDDHGDGEEDEEEEEEEEEKPRPKKKIPLLDFNDDTTPTPTQVRPAHVPAPAPKTKTAPAPAPKSGSPAKKTAPAPPPPAAKPALKFKIGSKSAVAEPPAPEPRRTTGGKGLTLQPPVPVHVPTFGEQFIKQPNDGWYLQTNLVDMCQQMKLTKKADIGKHVHSCHLFPVLHRTELYNHRGNMVPVSTVVVKLLDGTFYVPPYEALRRIWFGQNLLEPEFGRPYGAPQFDALNVMTVKTTKGTMVETFYLPTIVLEKKVHEAERRKKRKVSEVGGAADAEEPAPAAKKARLEVPAPAAPAAPTAPTAPVAPVARFVAPYYAQPEMVKMLKTTFFKNQKADEMLTTHEVLVRLGATFATNDFSKHQQAEFLTGLFDCTSENPDTVSNPMRCEVAITQILSRPELLMALRNMTAFFYENQEVAASFVDYIKTPQQ